MESAVSPGSLTTIEGALGLGSNVDACTAPTRKHSTLIIADNTSAMPLERFPVHALRPAFVEAKKLICRNRLRRRPCRKPLLRKRTFSFTGRPVGFVTSYHGFSTAREWAHESRYAGRKFGEASRRGVVSLSWTIVDCSTRMYFRSTTVQVCCVQPASAAQSDTLAVGTHWLGLSLANHRNIACAGALLSLP